MSESLISIIQSYIGYFLQLNILLVTANGYLFIRSPRFCSKILIFLSLVLSIIIVIIILYADNLFIIFSSNLDPKLNPAVYWPIDIRNPLRPLDWAFWIDILALSLTAVGVAFENFKK